MTLAPQPADICPLCKRVAVPHCPNTNCRWILCRAGHITKIGQQPHA